MPTRQTAYVSTNHDTHGHGCITFDLYVLWPEGHEQQVQDLLDDAVQRLRERVGNPDQPNRSSQETRARYA